MMVIDISSSDYIQKRLFRLIYIDAVALIDLIRLFFFLNFCVPVQRFHSQLIPGQNIMHQHYIPPKDRVGHYRQHRNQGAQRIDPVRVFQGKLAADQHGAYRFLIGGHIQHRTQNEYHIILSFLFQRYSPLNPYG